MVDSYKAHIPPIRCLWRCFRLNSIIHTCTINKIHIMTTKQCRGNKTKQREKYKISIAAVD